MLIMNRRKVLGQVLRGAGVAVALPFLNCFLDGNGEALASGVRIPPRFGTWFWGCGVNAARWIPDKLGTGYDLKAELKSMEPVREKLTVLSGFNCILGDKPALMHWTGIMATFTGVAPTRGGTEGGAADAPTLDCLVSDAIGGNTRFRSLEVACTGNPGGQLQHAQRIDCQSQ